MPAVRARKPPSIRGSDHSALSLSQRTLRRVARVVSLGAACIARRTECRVNGCALLFTEYGLALAVNQTLHIDPRPHSSVERRDHHAAPDIIEQRQRAALPRARIVIRLKLHVPNPAHRTLCRQLELSDARRPVTQLTAMLRCHFEKLCELSCPAPLALAHERGELATGSSSGKKGQEGDQNGEAPEERGGGGKGAERIGLHDPIVSAPSCHLVVTCSPLSCT